MSNTYYWEKLTLSKLVGIVNFMERKFEEMHYVTFKGKKVQGIFGGTFILALLSSAIFRLQNHVSDLFWSCFAQDIKGFYQSSLGNEVDFGDIMKVSPNIFAIN